MRFSRLSDWLAWQETLHPTSIDLGLERVGRTLARLQWRRPSCPIITVGGTNGKGSTVALTARILAAAGYRVGTFTSPHLLTYNERITIAGRQVSDIELVEVFARIDAARGADTLTFFEFNALAALLVFETAALDAIVLEVGMGGRLDAVNAVDADVAIVSSIALDHCEWLGSDVEAIAREKAGIFRAGRPALFGSRTMPRAIAEAADRIGSRLLQLGVDFDATLEADGWRWRGTRSALSALPAPALAGDIQFDNAATVLTALECLAERLAVSRDAIERGLLTVALPGRFQVFPGQVEWILDVAHNPAAAQTLARQLAARPRSGRTIAICGILGDKDIEGVVTALQGCFDIWIAAEPASARALSAEALARRMTSAGARVEEISADVASSCERARVLARPGDRIVVFGSFLTVAPALQWLNAGKLQGA